MGLLDIELQDTKLTNIYQLFDIGFKTQYGLGDVGIMELPCIFDEQGFFVVIRLLAEISPEGCTVTVTPFNLRKADKKVNRHNRAAIVWISESMMTWSEKFEIDSYGHLQLMATNDWVMNWFVQKIKQGYIDFYGSNRFK